MHADQPRSFLLPPRFITSGFRKTQKHTLNVLAAVECQDLAFVLVDFARLVTIHVISLNRHWKEEDVIPGAEHWHDIWSPQQGPDWIDETSAAIEEVHRWRAEVLDGSGSGHLPIVKHLSDEQRAFNGFGRHLSHDVVYSLGIHPGMPASDVCRDDVLFSQFVSTLQSYMSRWTSQQYLIRVANIPNSENPFAFNDISNQRYLSESVLVYHKQCVYVPAELNDRLARAGMYDPSHIIGEPYTKEIDPKQLCAGRVSRTERPVIMLSQGRFKVYTPILATPPPTWAFQPDGQGVLAEDIRHAGDAPTLGFAQADGSLQNTGSEGTWQAWAP